MALSELKAIVSKLHEASVVELKAEDGTLYWQILFYFSDLSKRDHIESLMEFLQPCEIKTYSKTYSRLVVESKVEVIDKPGFERVFEALKRLIPTLTKDALRRVDSNGDYNTNLVDVIHIPERREDITKHIMSVRIQYGRLVGTPRVHTGDLRE